MKRLGDGSPLPKTPRRKLDPQARTWLIALAGVAATGLALVPLVAGNARGANAVYITARSEAAVFDTPAPYALTVATPTPTPAGNTPTPTNAIQISEYLQLQLDDDYPTVEHLQTRLMDLGYLDSDEPTTVYGTATAAAVALFQRTLAQEQTGVADIELQEHLFSGDAVAYETRLGDSGSDIEGMQSRLHELGYYDGKINGYFGVATEAALTAFQAKNETTADAVFHVSDRELLYSPDARPKIDPTPSPTPKPKPSAQATRKPTKTNAPTQSSDTSSSSGTPSFDTSTPSFNASYSPDGIVSVATAMLGKPYVLSEESPSKGFDCSGLVYYCLRTCGVSTGRYNSTGFSNVSGWGYVGSTGELVKGDLVFFNSPSSSSVNHTGIYIGGGRFIHASSSKGTVLTSSIGTNYWTTYFVNGRRVF